MYYGFYSAITRVVNPTSLFSNLMCGYIAELCRVPFVYPIEMVASRMMTRGLTAGQSIKQLHSEGGMAQFWKGSELFLGNTVLFALLILSDVHDLRSIRPVAPLCHHAGNL